MMLGVRRPMVSITAHIMQQGGLISYSRGQMRILDGEGLRNGSCVFGEQFEKVFQP